LKSGILAFFAKAAETAPDFDSEELVDGDFGSVSFHLVPAPAYDFPSLRRILNYI
jgi:hypothetical protein